MLIFLLKTFIFCFLIWCIYKLIQARLSPLAKIPGYPLYNPVLGNMTFLLSKGIFDRWQYTYNNFGTVYRWYTFMGQPFLNVSSPEYVKQILITNSKNYIRGSLAGAEIFRKIMGNHSMVIIDGHEHRRHRSIVSPAFRIGNLRKLLPVMQDCAIRLCNHLDEKISDQGQRILKSIDIRQHLSHVTLTVIGLAGFGFDFDCIDKPNRLAEVISNLTTARSNQTLLRILPYSYYYPIPSVRDFWKCLWSIHDIISDLIRSKMSAKLRGSPYAQKDLLDMILENSDKTTTDQSIDHRSGKNADRLSEGELRDEIMTFILAGHETSSLALTWTVAMLCLHDDWQEKCRHEIDAVISDKEITWDQLDRLKITKAVVQETMRLYPPIYALSRHALDDDQFGQYTIPAGTGVFVIMGQMHRLPEYWADPTNFIPERFLQDDVPWDAYLPFGDGSHKCVGYQFAMAEILTVLAVLLKKYKFRLAMDWGKMEAQAYVTLQPVVPILIDIIPV